MPSQKVFYRQFVMGKKKHAVRLARVVAGVLNQAVDSVAQKVKAGASPSSSLPSAKELTGKLIRVMSPVAVTAHNDAALRTLNQVRGFLGREVPPLANQKKFAVAVSKAGRETRVLADLGVARNVKNVYSPDVMSKIKTIAPEFIDRLRDKFSAGFVEGEGIPGLTDIVEEFRGHDDFKAERIAQTESTRIVNEASAEVYEATGVVEQKQWITNMMGGRSRPAHEEAHEQIVPVDEPFIVGDDDHGYEELDYPGDPAGSDWNVINCQCAIMPITVLPETGAEGEVPEEEDGAAIGIAE